MSASFPSSVKSFTTKLSGDTIQPAHLNDVQAEITAIETAMIGGTLPSANGAALTNVDAATLGGSTSAQLQTAFLQAMMPVGFVVTLGVSTNPATLYGFGPWAAIAGRVIVGLDSGQTEFDTLNETGGAKTHALTEAELATHTHVQNAHTHVQTKSGSGGGTTDFSVEATRNTTYTASASTTQSTTATNQNTGSGTAHNNLQPYIVKYVWQRTV